MCVLKIDNKTIIMTVDQLQSTVESIQAQKDRKVTQAGIIAYVALACAVAGLAFCWYPILGAAHAIAGTILGVMARKRTARRAALYAIIAGALAIIASAVMTIIELNSTEIVTTYDASPWF